MFYYYIYNIVMYSVSRFGLRLFLVVFLSSYPLFLYLLPATDFDFLHYRDAYETMFFDPQATLFFHPQAELTAEPGWFLYTGLTSIIIHNFRSFLVLNCILTTICIGFAIKRFGIRDEINAQILALMIPIQFLVVYFWSPRSALPLGLTFLLIAFLREGRFVLSAILALCAVSLHSQYGLFIIFCGLYYALVFVIRQDRSALTRISLPLIGAIAGGVIALSLMISYVLPLLSFLPSFEVISSKTRYLSQESESFRATAVLSLVVFPALLVARWSALSKRKEFDVVVLFVIFSMTINALFFYNAHVAGRLARASDYFLFSYFLIDATRLAFGKYNFILIIIVLSVFPLLFGELYPLNEIY